MNTADPTAPGWLTAAPLSVKWAVTLFLGSIGIAYVFGVLMVTLWVGLTPEKVAQAYRPPQPSAAPEQLQLTEQPIDLDEALGEEEVHQIDERLLIQDTHVHVPMYALIALALSAISVGLRGPSRMKIVLVFALFLGPIIDFLGMWLTRLVASGFSYLTLAGGWLMAASYAVVAGAALWQMWFTDHRRLHQ
ncbi:MAG: hypothetical protein ACE5HT_04440 [Gemmatimonadales bacterium]